MDGVNEKIEALIRSTLEQCAEQGLTISETVEFAFWLNYNMKDLHREWDKNVNLRDCLKPQ